jgi:hypothetical protein
MNLSDYKIQDFEQIAEIYGLVHLDYEMKDIRLELN